jgi:hypothetical protein
MPMIKVPYDIKSNMELVRGCLEKKRYNALNIFGFGPHSCSAHLEFNHKFGFVSYSYGNSRIKMEVEAYKPDGSDKYKDSEIACHGESSAIMAALESVGSDLTAITKLYVELSPCAARCAGFLANVNPGLINYYSFDHPKEVPDWKKAATQLCK